MQRISELKSGELFEQEEFDVFIGSSSFEKRCFAVVEQMGKLRIDQAIVYRVVDLDQRIIKNSEQMIAQLNAKNSLCVDLKISDPAFSFFNLTKSLNDIFEGDFKKIAIDITTFTHEGLLMMLKIVHRRKRTRDNIHFYYNGAKEYSSKEDRRDDKWLTKGVKDVRSIIGYSGYFDPSQESHLIVLFGFERERTIRLIDEFEYNMVSLAFADREGSIALNHQEINEERHRQILNLYSNAKMFKISLKDPSATKSEILNYVEKAGVQNVVLAPMNNKISTIGAGLAAIENRSIQLCYLEPNRYNLEGYSKAGSIFYVWEM